jgi:hypothetical protein
MFRWLRPKIGYQTLTNALGFEAVSFELGHRESETCAEWQLSEEVLLRELLYVRIFAIETAIQSVIPNPTQQNKMIDAFHRAWIAQAAQHPQLGLSAAQYPLVAQEYELAWAEPQGVGSNVALGTVFADRVGAESLLLLAMGSSMLLSVGIEFTKYLRSKRIDFDK